MPEKIEVTLQVTNQVQAQELRDAWLEIVTGQKLAHAQAIWTYAVKRGKSAMKNVVEAAVS